MGDRGVIVVTTSGGEMPPCGVYVHWHGSSLPGLLPEAIKRMRKGDVAYATARLIGYLHEQIEGPLCLGVLEPPKDLTDDSLREYSQGDAGVVILNCTTGEVRAVGGYLGHRPDFVDSEDHVSGMWADWTMLAFPACC